jgi:hypothetical protein
MRAKKLVFNLFVFFLHACLYAQSGNSRPIETVAQDLIRNIRSNSKENIQIRTDKLLYAVTEKVWFKVFILDSVSDKLLATSGNLYIDVVDRFDQPIVSVFQHAAHKESGGSIKLPDTASSGIYWLRAYTKVNAQGATANLAIRPLVLINSQKSGNMEQLATPADEKNAGVSSKMSALIFPEGGHLMAGEDNLIIVKLEDLNGHPVADSIMVKDNQGRMVDRFITNSSGLVKFRFNPTSRGRYSLFAKNGTHYDSVCAMPKVNFYSAQLSISDQNSQSVKFKVLLEDSLFKKDFTTYLLGINKDSVCFASVGKGMYEGYLPVNSFPAGISRLMLFNEQGILLSERDVLLTQTTPKISANLSKAQAGPHEKIDLDIQMTDAEGKPMLATYALSVADNRMSDHGPSFFGDSTAMDQSTEMDMRLISNGQTGGGVASLSNENAPGAESFNPFRYEGVLLNRKGKGLANYQISMLSTGQHFMVLQDTTELNGNFLFDLPQFNDSLAVEFNLKALVGFDQDYVIRSGQKHLPTVLTTYDKKLPWLKKWPEYQQLISKYQFDTLFAQAHGMLPLVTVSKSVVREPAKASKSNVLTREQLLAYGTESVGNIILTIQGVHINSGYLVIRGVTAFQPSAIDEPLLIMDGSQVNLSGSADAGETSSPVLAYLKTLNVRQIESIRVLNGAESAEYGVRGGHGVIEITTTTTPEKEEIKVNKKYWLVGYMSPSAFPVDESGSAASQKTNKINTTLYWNGDLVTDPQGSNKISFYTDGLVTDYLITIAGISSKGERIYKTVILKM